MSSIKVSVQDGNNVQLLVTPQPRIDLTIDKGAFGPTGPAGTPGPTGPTGPQGQGLELTGVVPTPSQLPPTGQPGEQYYVQSTNTAYVWSDT